LKIKQTLLSPLQERGERREEKALALSIIILFPADCPLDFYTFLKKGEKRKVLFLLLFRFYVFFLIKRTFHSILQKDFRSFPHTVI